MQSKEKNLKTICTENNTPAIPLPAGKVAEIAGVSESLVKKVRNGKRNNHTPAGQRVEVTEELWAEGSNQLINAIKKVVNL
jgi:hypothetical protein